MNWHASSRLLDTYARGAATYAEACSLEAHVMACETCRAAIPVELIKERLDRTWEAIADELHAPKGDAWERMILRTGVPDYIARLLATTPSLRVAWVLALGAVLSFGVLASYVGNGIRLPFLLLAPLVPLIGVAGAYGPVADPAFEVALAAPMRSFKLLLIRATGVLTVSLVLGSVGAVLLPQLDWMVVAWLLPSLALVSISLALSTLILPVRSAAFVAVVWVGGVLTVEYAASEPLTAFRMPAQGGYLLIALLGSLVFATRRRILDEGRQS